MYDVFLIRKRGFRFRWHFRAEICQSYMRWNSDSRNNTMCLQWTYRVQNTFTVLQTQLQLRTVQCQAYNPFLYSDPIQTSNKKKDVTKRQNISCQKGHRRIHGSSSTTLTHHVSDSFTERDVLLGVKRKRSKDEKWPEGVFFYPSG